MVRTRYIPVDTGDDFPVPGMADVIPTVSRSRSRLRSRLGLSFGSEALKVGGNVGDVGGSRRELLRPRGRRGSGITAKPLIHS